ncbi:MAG: MopE-related protein [Myxococcaceae bacterium]
MLLFLAAACGRTTPLPRAHPCVFESDCPTGLHCINAVCQDLILTDGGPFHGSKRFGEPCDAGQECASDFCIGGPVGSFCTQTCEGADAGCPFAFDCKAVPVADAGLTDLCAVPQPLLCQSCTSDLECGASGADLCLGLDGGDRFCGVDCTFDSCPPLYSCEARGDRHQCVPAQKTCDCLPETVGMMKGCRSANSLGACQGNQICQLDGGFTSCNAPPAAAETCNGVDDDCNGVIDDFTPPDCSVTVGGATCTGPQVCRATAGLVCTVAPPAAEVCNGFDDDCNGKVDDPYVDSTGRYVQVTDCGGCTRDCHQLIAHSVTVSCDAADAGLSMICHAQSCEAGFFLSADRTQCLALPDALCHPCATDSDCVGPGNKCLLIDGDHVCGQDCSAGSVYGTSCPSGYACTAGQCQPTTNSCNCTSGSVGAQRSCTVQTCKGFQQCGGGGPSWSTCDVNSYNPEICDGVDNNCNGQVDEGWLNQATGRYDTAANCGFCNNDCTKYFSPTLQHTTGVCDTTPSMPACKMGACLTETDGGITFEFVDVDGLPADGCECKRVQGNTTVDLPDRTANSSGGLSWVDENCDGVDGVVSDALFVSATAAAGGNGTRTAPLQTIAAALTQLNGSGKKYILVAQGLYRENVTLFEGAQLFGGYSSDFLHRDPAVYASTLVGQPATSTSPAGLFANGLGKATAETVVAGFTLLGWDVNVAAGDGVDGAASVVVLLQDCGPRMIVQSNQILGGRGGAGGRGKTGTQGTGRQSSTAVNGINGLASDLHTSGTCSGASRSGGSGGKNSSCTGADGFAGGNAVCPTYNMTTFTGTQEQYTSPTSNGNGRGGWDWTFDSQSGNFCGHATESGWPSNIQAHEGADGAPGNDGTGGTAGAGAPSLARFGSVVGGRWVSSPNKATGGNTGGTAVGGGGGGSGGGVAQFTSGGCQQWELGATGGGGGAGACGGAGGTAGAAGGASIAVLVTFTSATTAANLPTLSGNQIGRGPGGDGGPGGFGGAGGLGGAGGFGGQASQWFSSVGGKGGNGGNGGPGGGGGGGAGGPSLGVLVFNGNGAGYQMANTFLGGGTTAAGQGGAGGSSEVATGTGTAGAGGASNDLLSLTACSSGCPSATTCDANGVCVPN